MDSPSPSQLSLMSSLKPWREVVVLVYDVLTWKQEWHPLLLTAVLTLKFVLLWWCEPTLITCVALALLAIVLADFLGPLILPHIFKADQWTDGKGRAYESACVHLVSGYDLLLKLIHYYSETKSNKPIMHFSVTVATLVSVAWMGNALNNLFVLYLLALAVVLLPGLHSRGFLGKFVAMLVDKMDGGKRDRAGNNKKVE